MGYDIPNFIQSISKMFGNSLTQLAKFQNYQTYKHSSILKKVKLVVIIYLLISI